MAGWETEDESAGRLAASTLSPTLEASLSASAGPKLSRQRSITPPGDKSSKRSSRDMSKEEPISMLDPRRFTPTLHANLVSEILALRRDQEEKTRVIENLESTLHSTKQEHESLHQDFTLVSKESRSLKRQMSLLEGGTSSALGELARERDEAVESVSETKKRLDIAQKKIRNQEDDSQRVHDIWSKEKDNWDDEKRKYERRLHVAESRLKSILEEVAAYQAAHQHSASSHHDNDIDEAVRDNDAASVRTMSMTNSLRYSLVQSPGPAQQAGHSLADELGFDADDDDQSDYDGAESVLSSPQVARTASREGGRHQRNYSTESGPSNAVRSKLFMNTSVMDALEGVSEETQAPASKITYTETGVQYSPPPSPILAPAEKPAATRTESVELETGPLGIEANQSRKRSQLNLKTAVVEPPAQSMVSTSAQTIETPISPPRTPKLADEFDEADAPTEKPSTMVSSASQTESSPKAPKLTFTAPPLPPLPPIPVDIPSISIQPPTSRPTTPLSPRLPQHFKNFGCQVNLPAIATSTSDAAVQTEGIQVDKRLARLPAHLQPSAITSRPSSPVKEVSTAAGRDFTPAPANAAARQPLRVSLTQAFGEPPSSPIESTAEDGLDVYLGGHNDDGPLSVLQKSPLRRPRRYSSLFAGFDSASSDGADEFGDAEVSDSEYRTALSAPRPQSTASRPSKRSSFGTATTSPDQATYRSGHSSAKSYRADLYNSFGITDNSIVNKHSRKSSRAQEKSAASSVTSGSKPGSAMRKAAIIQNGIANQQTRSRSPSLPDGRNPPFPIPTRDSSKRLLFNAYNPSEAPSSPPRESDYRRSGSRSQYNSNNVRRVRSAAALARNQRSRQHSGGSPPPMSVSTEATEITESPGMPPLPRNDLTTPRNRDRSGSHYRRHRQELSTTTANTAHTANTLNTDPMSTSQASTSQSSGVVDAIAQTMVGEWMYKYVRRRKSFSVPDAGKDDSGNDRHKRWVWLAPYERSILWSSRQPSSGSALMGKSGRKLTIQSVLDVKDDNPAPKTAGPVFNRSILILTPQRALKFTAVNAERHYLWLTALSFLAHSSQAVPENITAPQAQLKPPPAQQQPLPEFEPPVAKARRPGIRDSIRLAKGKGTSNPRSGPPSVPSIPSVPSTRMGEVASFRVPPSSGVASNHHTREKSGDAAEPPMVPRFDNNRKVPTSAHGRKRSNTGSHIPPPVSFRGFSGPVGSPALTDGTYSTADNSVDTVGSDMYYSQASSNTTWGMSQGGSQRTSEASTRPSNFFDAIGTVRMEAFISPLAFSQVNDYTEEHDRYRKIVRRRSKEIRRRNSRSRQRDSYSSRGGRSHDDYYGGSRTAGEEEIFRDDPFKGF